MATVTQYLTPEEASLLPAAGFPEYRAYNGSSFPLTGLAFDGGSTIEEAYWKFTPVAYAGGNVTVDIIWYADSGTNGGVSFGVGLAAITPDVDTQDPTTKSFGTTPSVTDTHLGTTARRLHKATVTLSGSQLNSMSDGDECWLRLLRSPSAGADTITADVIVTSVRVSYSDV